MARNPQRQNVSRGTADGDYDVALKLINQLPPRAKNISFTGLRELKEIPPEIANLKNLRSVSIDRTNVEKFDVIFDLPLVTNISLVGSPISEIPDGRALNTITNLQFHGSTIRDISNLQKLKKIRTLSLHGTGVKNVSPLSGLTTLNHLYLGANPIRDISSLKNLINLRGLYLHETRVRNLSAVLKMRKLQTLTLPEKTCESLEPLRNLRNLTRLTCGGESIRSIEPISGLVNLSILAIEGSEVEDISPLVELQNLRSLTIERSPVRDIRPLRALQNLRLLSINDLSLADMNPLGSLTNLSDAVIQNPNDGLSLDGGESQESPELAAISNLDEPDRTVLFVNYFRRRSGQEAYWPDGYEGETEVLVQESDAEEGADEPEDSEVLAQRPAPYRFSHRDLKLHAQLQTVRSIDGSLARQIQEALRGKSQSILDQLVENLADERVANSVREFSKILENSPEEMPAGLLLMRFRSIEADATSYMDSTSERDRATRALLGDLANSAEDFLSLFPDIRAIESNRVAMRFAADDRQLRDFRSHATNLVRVAQDSELVDESVVGALLEGARELSSLDQIVATSPSEVVRAAAIEKRASIAGLQALDIRNFAAATMTWFSEEFGPLAKESWKETKAAIPRGVGKGVESAVSASIKVGVAGLVSQIAGPIMGIAILITTFMPLAKRVGEATEEKGDEE